MTAADAMWWWAERVREWQKQGRDVWLYFNNDEQGFAAERATSLRQAVVAQGG